MGKRRWQEIEYFFFSQQFADGIRITMAVLLPALILSYFDLFNTGLTISIGAFCVSLVDTPGPIIHRKNSMLISSVLVFVVALITGFARSNIYTMGMEVFVFAFFFSMFNVYGNRAAFVGNAALLILVLTMDKPAEINEIVGNSFWVLFGGLWYMTISLISYQVRPYRTAERALGDSLRELSTYLHNKADFYNVHTSLEDDYRKLVSQQMVVSEKQDMVRELLFKTRLIVNESTNKGRRLILAFIDSVDLFEDITATYYDYTSLRNKYKDVGILSSIHSLTKKMAGELDAIGIAIQSNKSYALKENYENALLEIKNQIDAFSKTEAESSHLVLKKIIVILRKMIQRFDDLLLYFNHSSAERSRSSASQHKLFVGHQSLDPKLFWNNLSFQSTVFRHSFRVAVACIIGFILAKSFAKGYHSYWILMTIAIMLKPAFSLTKKRNYERIVGTISGGLLGVIVLAFITNKNILFGLMVLFMIGSYSFMRAKYLISVVFMTPFIFILFKFLGVGFLGLAKERILDTLLGCVIALVAGYVIFPDWESGQLKNHLEKMLKANIHYFQKLAEGLLGKNISIIEYRLVRKEVYVVSANLSAAFQRMLSEPKSKQKNKREIHQFVVLNHILFSNIATLASAIITQNNRVFPDDIIRSAKKALIILCESVRKFNPDCDISTFETIREIQPQQQVAPNAEDALLKEQLDFIYRLSTDIAKTTETIISGQTIQLPVHNP